MEKLIYLIVAGVTGTFACLAGGEHLSVTDHQVANPGVHVGHGSRRKVFMSAVAVL